MVETTTEAISELMMIIWRGIPADYKSRYRMSIWRQFEDQIRSAAYTNNLGKFVNSICLKLNAQIGINKTDREHAEFLLNNLNDRQALKLLREETTLIVLMVRIANQDRNDAWKKRVAEEENLFNMDEEGES